MSLNYTLWRAGNHHHHYYYHRVLLLPVEHRAYMKNFQARRSPAIPLTSFHDLPVFLISSSNVFRHVLFSLPFLLYPWGFQSNAVFSIAPASLCNVCPIQFHFLLFIWISVGFCLVIRAGKALYKYSVDQDLNPECSFAALLAVTWDRKLFCFCYYWKKLIF